MIMVLYLKHYVMMETHQDILVMGTSPLIPGCVAMARPICYMVMEDEKGQDEKVVLSEDQLLSCRKMSDLPPTS